MNDQQVLNSKLLQTIDKTYNSCNQDHIKPMTDQLIDIIDTHNKNVVIDTLSQRRQTAKNNEAKLDDLKYNLALLCQKWENNGRVVDKIINFHRKRHYQKILFNNLKTMRETTKFIEKHNKLMDLIYRKKTVAKVFNYLKDEVNRKKLKERSECLIVNYEKEVVLNKQIYEEYVERLSSILESKQQELEVKTKRLMQLKEKCQGYATG